MNIFACRTDMMRPFETNSSNENGIAVNGTAFVIKGGENEIFIHLDYRINERPSMALQLMSMLRCAVSYVKDMIPKTIADVDELLKEYVRKYCLRYKVIHDSAVHLLEERTH